MRTIGTRRAGERGNAMVIALLMLLVLTGVGMSYVLQTKTETQIAGNGLRWSQALYNADAGVAEALGRMADPSDTASYIGEPANTATPGWGVYIVEENGAAAEDNDPGTSADALDNDDDGSVDESGEQYPERLTLQVGDDAIPYRWVRVTYLLDDANNVIRFGDHDSDITTPQQFNLVEGAPVIRVTAEGRRGNAVRRVEVEAVKPAIDLVRTAIYSEDDNFKFNGTAFRISGEDYDPATGDVVPGSTSVPGIMTTENPDNIADALNSHQVDNILGDGGTPSVTTSPVDLDLEAMFEVYRPLADINVPAGTYSNVDWGSYDDYHVVKVDGDLHTAGTVSGGGILLIDGSFTCTGQFTWYGLVVVLGDISFSGGGTGVHIYGSVQLSGNLDKQTVGGNADIFYSSAALDRLSNLGPYRAISWLEL